MEYKYYNQFNLSSELSQTISSLISKKEKDSYVCRIITVTIPEREGTIFHSPLTDNDIYRPGYSSLNGAQIRAINEEYGWYSKGIIPAEKYSFFVVMKNDNLEAFSKLLFNYRSQIEETLKSYSVICKRYFGVFDSKILIQTFPYLQEFFDYLDKWRAETGRVTIDDNVLEKGMRKALAIRR